MFELLKLRVKHGNQAVPDVAHAVPPATFRGRPVLHEERCLEGCRACVDACPTGAVVRSPLRLDMGACIFCADCVRACPTQAIELSREHRIGTASRQALVVTSRTVAPSNAADPERAADDERAQRDARGAIRRLYGRSLRLRQVSAGGCNGCELELGAAGNVNFDMSRFGIDFVASPRHADGIVITGPVTRNMASALADVYRSVPPAASRSGISRKLVIAVGACAISGGIFASSPEVAGTADIRVDLYVPGCPPHPLVFIRALLDFLGKR